MFGTIRRTRSLPITTAVNVEETLDQVSNQVRIFDVSLKVDSHLMHTPEHFQNSVSITSVHFATSVPPSH